jgi:hypothetical protein
MLIVFQASLDSYDLLLVTIIKSQVCYEEPIPLDTKCLSPSARSELLADIECLSPSARSELLAVGGFPSAPAAAPAFRVAGLVWYASPYGMHIATRFALSTGTLPYTLANVTNLDGVTHTANAIHHTPRFLHVVAQSGFERATSPQNRPERQLRHRAHNMLEHNSGVST